ncbi:Transcriptional regulatory protein [Burkholderia singularis]|uniref:Transcriptional regulatory protein n=1 Tax=Burkholderia singularis TaxID=1503053 RepID=A0A238HCH3_9BURK|nr:Transcriptional regulatory protein [Burkholderia singularis]
MSFDVVVEALSLDLPLSLVARGAGLGVAAVSALARNPHRAALKVIEAPGIAPGIHVWLVHGVLPGRQMCPVELLRDQWSAVLEAENGAPTASVARLPAH